MPEVVGYGRRRGLTVKPYKAKKSAGVSGIVKRLSALSIQGAPAGRRRRPAMVGYGRKKQNIKKNIVKGSTTGLPSFSKFSLSNKANATVKAMKRVSEPNFYVTNFGSQTVQAEGFQNAELYGTLNLTHLQAMAALTPGGGTTYPAAFKRYHIESVAAEFLMTNSSLATQYVDIYDIVRTRDMGNSPSTGDPLQAWIKGVSDQTSAPPDYTAWQNINSLPTDSKLFCDYFRIVKRSHIGLVAGATHRHQVLLKPNRVIDTALTNALTGDPAGITVYTLVVINGQPASIKTETGAVVTTATTALDVVWSMRAKFSWVSDNTRIWKVLDNLSSLTGEVITQPSLGSFVANTVA